MAAPTNIIVPAHFFFETKSERTKTKMRAISVPVKSHYRNGHFVRRHDRIMYVKGSKQFKQTVTRIAEDPEVFSMPPNINVVEVERIRKRIPGKMPVGRTYPAYTPWSIKGADILIHKKEPYQGHTLLHEIGHIDDKLKRQLDVVDEERADQFADRKSKELGFAIPPDDAPLDIEEKGGLSKWERKVISKEEGHKQGMMEIPW